jgi:hypothetical protein
MTSILKVPMPSKESGQKSIDVSDLFLTRFTPPWARPASLPAWTWRQWVLNQPVAIVCRETLIANLMALDWKITPIDSNYKQELNPTIKYYTRLFQHGGEYPGLGLDFAGLLEWVIGDVLDIPFGGAAEIGRKGGSPNGRVQWIRPLDGGTLYPTLNQDWPVVQYYPNVSSDIVTFRDWEISRAFLSPQSFILREGWGMAPPEKIYFALDMLTKGDKYYANLLLDIPTAGVLDLGDMEKSSAEEWITAFRTFVNDNTTSFKIPVLYEHNNPVSFIPFGKVPNDIMFNQITSKYAALVAAAYGMSLSDIGLQTTSASGETLAGSIRQERRTRRSGLARIKSKSKAFFDQILPSSLEFIWIDYDEEVNVALGRARLASSQALKTWQDGGNLSPQEVRSQIIADGLVSISLPDELPPDAKPLMPAVPFGNKVGGNTEPEMIGNPVPPSAGGEGDVKSFVVKSKPRNLSLVLKTLVEEIAPRIVDTVSSISDDEMDIYRSSIADSLFDEIDQFGLQKLIADVVGSKSLVKLDLSGVSDELKALLGMEGDTLDLTPYMRELEENISKSINEFIGRSTIYLLNDAVFEGREVDTILPLVENSLQEIVSIHINQEARKMLNKIRLEN